MSIVIVEDYDYNQYEIPVELKNKFNGILWDISNSSWLSDSWVEAKEEIDNNFSQYSVGRNLARAVKWEEEGIDVGDGS